jgi:hypothetical protein
MRNLLLFGLGILFLNGFVQAKTVVLDTNNGRVETIYNVDVNGTFYNVSFDKAFGSQLFDGDVVTAEAAMDAVIIVLNDGGYRTVDNEHPDQVPIFYVVSDTVTHNGFAACRTGYIPSCSHGGWARIAMESGATLAPSAYFALAPQVVIDVEPADPNNLVYPNQNGNIPVLIKSSPEFDANQIKPNKLRFGPAEAAKIGTPTYPAGNDGADMLVKFRTQDAGIFCNDTEVVLTGETFAGEVFGVTDDVDATNCEEGGCHP